MRRLFLGFLACAAWSANAADFIDRGAEDLLRNPTLSQPFTVLDQLLMSLDGRARLAATDLRPEKNDFQPSRTGPGVLTFVRYDKSMARTHVEFNLTITSINDPWRDVCKKHLSDLVTFGLRLPYYKEWQEKEFRPTALGFFGDFLGSRLTSDQVQLTNYKSFSDSIVAELRLLQVSGGKPKFLRQCFWDNRTGQVSFREHKY
jgi:hypothetical protein